MKLILLILLSLLQNSILFGQGETDKRETFYLVCHTQIVKNKPSFSLRIFYIVPADIVDSFVNKGIVLNFIDGTSRTVDYLLYYHKRLGIYEVVNCNGWIEGDYFLPKLSDDVFKDNIEFTMQIEEEVNTLTVTKIKAVPQILTSINYGHIRTDQYVCFDKEEVERIPIEDHGHSILFYLMNQLLN